VYILKTSVSFCPSGRLSASRVTFGRLAAAWMCSEGPLLPHTQIRSSATCTASVTRAQPDISRGNSINPAQKALVDSHAFTQQHPLGG